MLHLQWLALPQADVAPPLPRAVRLHRARPPAAAHGVATGPLAPAARSLRPGRRALASAAARRSPSSASTRASSRTPSTRARRRAPTTARPLLALGVIRPYKGLPDAIEATRRARRTRGCSSRATRRCRSTGCASADASNGGSAISRSRSSTARSRRRRSRSSRTARSSTSRARSCRRSAPACRRSSTTSPASASRCARYGAGRVVPAGDVEALTEARARAARRRGGPRGRARGRGARAPVELTWDASAAQHLELYRELS